MNSKHAGPVNLGNPVEYAVLSFAKKIRKAAGSRSKLVFKPLPENDPTRRKPDISLARKLLRWKPRVSVDKGLKLTIDYFRRQLM